MQWTLAVNSIIYYCRQLISHPRYNFWCLYFVWSLIRNVPDLLSGSLYIQMQWKQIHFSWVPNVTQHVSQQCTAKLCLWAWTLSKIQKTRRQLTDCKAARHYWCIWLTCIDCWLCLYVHSKIKSSYWMQRILIAAFGLRSGAFLIWMRSCSEHRETKLCTKVVLHWQSDVDIDSFTYQFL